MRDLTIKVTVDTAQAEPGLKRVDDGVNKIEKSAEGASKATDGLQLSMSKIAQAAGGYVAIERSLENLTGMASASLKAFSEQESAVKKLTTALQAQGQATPAVIAQYDALATSFEKTTVFGDDLIQQMQALLVQVGNVMPEQMNAALTAATNLSAGLGVDLHTATMLVAKAFEGNTGTLSRYGIVIDEAKLKAEGITAVLEAINQKFGGQAQAQLDTYSGRVENLGNRWNNFQERIGDMIARVLTPLLNIFDAMPESLQTVAFALGTVTAVFAPLAGGVALVAQAFGVNLIPIMTGALMTAWATFSGFITATVIPMLTTALPIAIRGLATLFSFPTGLLVAAVLGVYTVWKNWDKIGPIVKGVYDAVKLWLVDKFGAIVNWIGDKVNAVTGFFADMYDKVVGNSYVPDMVAGIQVEFSKLPSVMVMPAQSATQSVANMFKRMQAEVVGHVQPMFSQLGSSIQTAVPSLFGGSGLFGSLMRTGLGSIFGPGGIAATLVAQGVEALAQVAWKGLKKIGGYFKDLFGGPSAAELAGREVVAAFEDNLADMLSESQKMEAGNEAWKATVIAIRDKYLEMGLSADEAMQDAERLWKSSKEGAEAAARVIEEIQRKFSGGISVPITFPTSGLPDVPTYHTGGVVDWPRAHSGLAIDEVPIVALRGEGVLNRGAMGRIGGAEGLNSLNRGGSLGGGTVVNINFHGGGYLDSPQTARRLAETVRRELDTETQRRRRFSRG